ncbi:MAG TPA: sulfotransferase, partial [Conexibacter sp.]
MKIIGAGLPRTATTTQWIALRMLGLPTYHMKDMM